MRVFKQFYIGLVKVKLGHTKTKLKKNQSIGPLDGVENKEKEVFLVGTILS